MKNLSQLSRRDLERLSAYLDQELEPKQRARLEARLQSDTALRQALEQLRATSGLLRSLPEVKVPRNFTLSPEMLPASPGFSLFPVYRMATVLAAITLVVVVGVDFLGSGRMRLGAGAPAQVELAAEDSMGAPAAEPAMEAEPSMGSAAMEEEELPMEAEAQEAPLAEAMEAPKAYEESELPGEADAAPVEAPRGTVEMEGEPEEQENLLPEVQADETLQGLPPIPSATPTPTGEELPALGATPIPLSEDPTWHDGPGWDLSPLRILEIASAAILVLFGSLTMFTRRKR